MNVVTDNLQYQRFEFKYILEDSVAIEVRNFVRSYLELDGHGAGFPDSAYPIHSVYLDSPDLRLYQATVNGDKNRFKLRLRYYDEEPASPVYCELKLRKNRTILKQRCAIRRSAVDGLLGGYMPKPPDLVSDEPKSRAALERFHQWMVEMQARPRFHIAYRREAWVNPRDNSVRVTMDRDVLGEAEPGAALACHLTAPVSVFDHKVILELKFTDRFPDWFNDMAQVFELVKCSAAKYVDGVTRLGPHRVSRACSPDGYAFPAPSPLRSASIAANPASRRSDQPQTGVLPSGLVPDLHE